MPRSIEKVMLAVLAACAVSGLGQERAVCEECLEEPSFDLLHTTQFEEKAFFEANEHFEAKKDTEVEDEPPKPMIESERKRDVEEHFDKVQESEAQEEEEDLLLVKEGQPNQSNQSNGSTPAPTPMNATAPTASPTPSGNATASPTSSPTPPPTISNQTTAPAAAPTAAPTAAPIITPAPTQAGASVVLGNMTLVFNGTAPALDQIRAGVMSALSDFLGMSVLQISVTVSLFSPRDGLRLQTPANVTFLITYQVQTQDPSMASLIFSMLVAAVADPSSLQTALQNAFNALGFGVTVTSVALSSPQLILGPGSGNGTASATDDPHVENLAGERFQVKQPGAYSLVRVPPEESSPALVKLAAKIQQEVSDPCRLYIKGVAIGGMWLGENVVQVLPLERDRPGANTAGRKTRHPFRIRISNPAGNATLSWEELDQAGNSAKVLGSGAAIQTFLREELSGVQEGRAFKFLIGTGSEKAEVIVAQASHQALNVQFAKAVQLQSHQVGGLMGTQKHDRHIEKATEGCLNSMSAWADASNTYWATLSAKQSAMIAAWD